MNNAGFSWFGPTDQLDEATFDELFAANVRRRRNTGPGRAVGNTVWRPPLELTDSS